MLRSIKFVGEIEGASNASYTKIEKGKWEIEIGKTKDRKIVTQGLNIGD